MHLPTQQCTPWESRAPTGQMQATNHPIGINKGTNLSIDFDVQADEVTAAVACELVLHAGISAAPALQLIKEVCHHLHTPDCYAPQHAVAIVMELWNFGVETQLDWKPRLLVQLDAEMQPEWTPRQLVHLDLNAV